MGATQTRLFADGEMRQQGQNQDQPLLQGYPNASNSASATESQSANRGGEEKEVKKIRNYFNLRKDTLKLEPVEGKPMKYRLSFKFDITKDTVCGIFCTARELWNMKYVTTGIEWQTKQHRFVFNKMETEFKSNIEFALPDLDCQNFQNNAEYYSVIVVMEAQSQQSRPFEKRRSQITFCTLDMKDSGVPELKVSRQKLQIGGRALEMKDIYGLNETSEAHSAEENKVCAICIFEIADTLVLPCRHLCLCKGCAQLMRMQTNRCPICRADASSLLRIQFPNSESDGRQTPVRRQSMGSGDATGEEHKQEAPHHYGSSLGTGAGNTQATSTLATTNKETTTLGEPTTTTNTTTTTTTASTTLTSTANVQDSDKTNKDDEQAVDFRKKWANYQV